MSVFEQNNNRQALDSQNTGDDSDESENSEIFDGLKSRFTVQSEK